MGDDRGQLVLEGAKLERIIPIASPGMVRLGGDQVAARDQFMALDGGIVARSPTAIFDEGFGVAANYRSLLTNSRR
jgi:hypothetical protein